MQEALQLHTGYQHDTLSVALQAMDFEYWIIQASQNYYNPTANHFPRSYMTPSWLVLTLYLQEYRKQIFFKGPSTGL